MIGSREMSHAFKGVGRFSLDVPVAALAALAVAFLAYVVSPDQLSGLVGATGLPEILPAAEPPLGTKARVAVAIAGALSVFLLVFALLRSLDRKPSKPRSARVQEASVETPRIRRRDHHPDAPARRPISATLEFGEPESVAPASVSTPVWLAPADLADESEPAGQSDPFGFDDDSAFDHAEPIAAPEPAVQAVEASPSLEPVRPAAPLSEPLRSQPESIAELMARLERGLRRQNEREPDSAFIAAGHGAGAEPEPRPSLSDDRLQSAIESLQKLASRQG
jgi:hypothetical protein